MFCKRKLTSVIFLHPFAGKQRPSISRKKKKKNPVYMQNSYLVMALNHQIE